MTCNAEVCPEYAKFVDPKDRRIASLKKELAKWKPQLDSDNLAGLPGVAGDECLRTPLELETHARIAILHEQLKPRPDNALIALLCDAVRLSRELRALVGGPIE